MHILRHCSLHNIENWTKIIMSSLKNYLKCIRYQKKILLYDDNLLHK